MIGVKRGPYVLISPCRDEADYLRRTLDTVLAQSVLPLKWVIVDDGSTDGSSEVLADYSARHPWIEVVRRDDRGHRAVGPGVIDAFYAGFAVIDPSDYRYLCKLDLDLELPPRYFELLMARMESDPSIATCSGKAYVRGEDGRLAHEGHGDDTSLGMTKFYRMDRFLAMGGFVREVMWDGIDCHRCRMRGWKACSWDLPELRFVHLRPMGSSQQGILTGRMRHGYGQYFMGTGPVYMLASALARLGERPWVIGSLAVLLGWLRSAVTRKPRYDAPGFRSFLRRYHRRVLLVGKRRAVDELVRGQHASPLALEQSGGLTCPLSLVLLNYGTPELVADCLDSLVEEWEPGAFRCVVVDNASPDDSAARISDHISRRGYSAWAELAVSPVNGGFSAGNNFGIRHQRAEAYLLLNSDTLLRRGAIASLKHALAQRPDAGLIGPRLEDLDGTAQISCFRWPMPVSEFVRIAVSGPLTRWLSYANVPMRVFDEPVVVPWLCFAAVLLRHELIEDIGLLDENYFMYYEDIDYSRRAGEAGWNVLHWPAARIVHLTGRTSSVESDRHARRRRPGYFYASRARYFRRFHGRVGLLAANLAWILGRGISLVRELVEGRRRISCEREWLDNWTGLFGQAPDRPGEAAQPSFRPPSPFRRRLLETWQGGLGHTGAAALYARVRGADGAVILMYHSVADAARAPWITPENHLPWRRFQAQVHWLARHRRVIGLSAMLDCLARGEPLPAGTVCLTFDDGYLDNFELALPLLAELELPATLFLPTADVDSATSQWVDRLYTCFRMRRRERLDLRHLGLGLGCHDLSQRASLEAAWRMLLDRFIVSLAPEREAMLEAVADQLGPVGQSPRLVMNWAEVRAAAERFPLVDIGSHSETQIDLSAHEAVVIGRELLRSREKLECELGRPVRHFSFPYNRVSMGAIEALGSAGYTAAVAAGDFTRVTSIAQRYSLPRIEAPHGLGRLALVTSGAYPELSQMLTGRA